ncbi:MAG: hypothetical protein AAFZ91_13140 [Pseudomonadota bacterium]
MPRRIISLLIACYAIAFAFGAMAAIRWPSLMMFADLILQEEPVSGLGSFDWRALGIAYGAPYFLAALCLYAAAITVAEKKRGSFAWYLMGCVSGFPCVFLVDFEPGWWQNPSAGEGAVAGAAAAALLLGIALWMLRQGQTCKPRPEPVEDPVAETPPAIVTADTEVSKPRTRKPVPAAVARQRAMFAAQGRKMLSRQRRKQQIV